MSWKLTQRCGRKCPLRRERVVWIHDPETWRSFYTLLYILDLIWLALSCRERETHRENRGREIVHQTLFKSIVFKLLYLLNGTMTWHFLILVVWHFLTINYSRWVCAGAFGGQWARQLSRLWRFPLPLPLPNPTALPQEGKGELQGGPGGGERQRVVCWRGGIGVWHLDWLQVGILLFFLSVLGLLWWCTRKKRKEGYTSCMARVCVWWWGDVQRGGGVEQ